MAEREPPTEKLVYSLQVLPFFCAQPHSINSMTAMPMQADSDSSAGPVPYVVKHSKLHGNGVLARRKIGAGARIIEYLGERISWDEATRRAQASGQAINHTFFFSLADGNVIDGGSGGNASRWINHSCEPNCEAYEDEGRIFIHALHDIARGEELTYSYPLIYEGRHTKAIKHAFACHCGTPSCTGTMLAPKRPAKKA